MPRLVHLHTRSSHDHAYVRTVAQPQTQRHVDAQARLCTCTSTQYVTIKWPSCVRTARERATRPLFVHVFACEQRPVQQKTTVIGDAVNSREGLQVAGTLKGLQVGQEGAARRNEDPSSTTVMENNSMWYAFSGDCSLSDGCFSSPHFPDVYAFGSPCQIEITSAWRGFLFVEYFSTSPMDSLFVDGVRFTGTDFHQGMSLHGSVPSQTILWSAAGVPSYFESGWKICQVESMPPFSVTGIQRDCTIDNDGCVMLGAGSIYISSCQPEPRAPCRVSISDAWQGTLDIVPSQQDWEGLYETSWDGFLEVSFSVSANGVTYSAKQYQDLMKLGLQGLEARGDLVVDWLWKCPDFRICPGMPANVSGPWGVQPWTCTILGDPCTGACTQQFSDSDDADGDGDLHNGHPRCESSVGEPFCGPCRCGAGEAQSYVTSSLYAHIAPLPLISCRPCEAGKFKLGNDTATDDCAVCSPGFSSEEGATACTKCDAGWFNNEESLDCVSCPPGFFAAGMGQTGCQQCTAGSYTVEEGQSSCHACWVGTSLVSSDVGCRECVAGMYATLSMTACSACETGTFQNASAQSDCYRCSDVLAVGSNVDLWTTMQRDTERPSAWREMSGASDVRHCGCGTGAWADSFGQCHRCGEGILCHGMGVVEVLPSYFASADNAGFVWRCHGADWRRCPGGVPGTCAEKRMNSSIACGECEAFTRMTNAGPCEVRQGKVSCDWSHLASAPSFSSPPCFFLFLLMCPLNILHVSAGLHSDRPGASSASSSGALPR